MNGILHSTKQLTAKPSFCMTNNWAPIKCSEGYDIYDSHFVAALVFFIATVERIVIAMYSLSQSNPVTASNSYRFGMKITLETLLKTVNDNVLGVLFSHTATVAFFTKKTILKYEQ